MDLKIQQVDDGPRYYWTVENRYIIRNGHASTVEEAQTAAESALRKLAKAILQELGDEA